MIPIIAFAALLGLVGIKLGGAKNFKMLKVGAEPTPTARPGQGAMVWNPAGYWQRAPKPQPATGYGPMNPQPQVNPLGFPGMGAGGYLAQLNQLVMQGMQPPMQLIQMALQEAYAIGDMGSVQAIQILFPPQVPMVMGCEEPQSNEEQVGIGAEAAPQPQSVEEWGELANPTQASQAQAKPQLTSVPAQPEAMEVPIDGVAPTQWGQFVVAMRTKKPGWSNSTHLGQFEHRRTRVRELGIDDDKLGDADSQYQAFCADISERQACNRGLIDQWVGKPVALPQGGEVQVTRSGALALLKAAGPEGALGWLSDPSDRKKFPRTTEMFTRCNNCF